MLKLKSLMLPQTLCETSEHPIQAMRNRIISLVVLMAMTCFFAADLYVPSMPAIAHALSVNKSLIQLTIADYLLAFALAPLLFGPMSDRFGRRPIVLIGLGCCLLGSVMCLSAMTINMLLFGRFIQGCGAGIAASLTRSIIRDCLYGEQLARAASYISLAMSIAPAIAPTIGGYVQVTIGWRGAFVVLAGLFIIMALIAFLWLPETNLHLNAKATKIKTMVNNYKMLLSSRWFISYVFFSASSFSGMILYYTVSPFLLQNQYHVSVILFGWLTATITLMNMLSRLVNVFLVRHLSTRQIIHGGLLLMNCAGLLMLGLTLLHIHSALSVVIPAALYVLGAGVVFSNAMVEGFRPFGHLIGAVSALYASLQVFSGFIVSVIASNTVINPQLTIAVLYTLLSSLSLWLFHGLPKTLKKVEDEK